MFEPQADVDLAGADGVGERPGATRDRERVSSRPGGRNPPWGGPNSANVTLPRTFERVRVPVEFPCEMNPVPTSEPDTLTVPRRLKWTVPLIASVKGGPEAEPADA